MQTDLLNRKNEAKEQPSENNYVSEGNKIKKNCRGRPPLNSCSSSASTCSENSIKDVN